MRSRFRLLPPLLKHNLQVWRTSLNVRGSRREFQISMLSRDVRTLFSYPLQHDLGHLDHSSKERFRLLRPLLEIFLLASELLRPIETFRVNETRSVFPNMSCREIVDGTHCCCQSGLIGNLGFQRDHFLLKFCDNLLNCQRNPSRIDNVSNNSKLHTRCETGVSRAHLQTKVLWQLW